MIIRLPVFLYGVARYLDVYHHDTGEDKRHKNKNLGFMRVRGLSCLLDMYHHDTQ